MKVREHVKNILRNENNGVIVLGRINQESYVRDWGHIFSNGEFNESESIGEELLEIEVKEYWMEHDFDSPIWILLIEK